MDIFNISSGYDWSLTTTDYEWNRTTTDYAQKRTTTDYDWNRTAMDYEWNSTTTNYDWNLTATDVYLPFTSQHSRDIWHWIFSICLFITAIITLLGNGLVMITFFMDKRILKSHFNIFLLNLTITDFAVSITAIPFYGVTYFLGAWPGILGPYLCSFFMFCDWGMTFASVYTLVTISIDRYWAVCWSHHYRAHNTKRRITVMVTITWILVLLVWLPAFIKDRVESFSDPSQTDTTCMWSIDNNMKFGIFMAICGYHLPTLIIVYCYIRVYAVMRQSQLTLMKKNGQIPKWNDGILLQLGPNNSTLTVDSLRSTDDESLSNKSCGSERRDSIGYNLDKPSFQETKTNSCDIEIIITTEGDNTPATPNDDKIKPREGSIRRIKSSNDTAALNKELQNGLGANRLSHIRTSHLDHVFNSNEKTKSTLSLNIPRPNSRLDQIMNETKARPRSLTDGANLLKLFNKKHYKPKDTSGECNNIRGSHTTKHLSSVSQTTRYSRAAQLSRQKRDYKLFVRVSYIVLAYVICWTPFHIVFDLSLADIHISGYEHWYTFATLMCYLNSIVNPILYALGNPKLKAAFKETLACSRKSSKKKEQSD